MKGLLLIGGQATRLGPLSTNLAKSLLPICDRHVLLYQIRQLVSAGIKDIILATGHHAEQLFPLRELYQSEDRAINLRISIESSALGTAGAIAHAKHEGLIQHEDVLVMNADILSNVRLADVVRQHAQHKRPATIVGYKVEDPRNFGLLQQGGDPDNPEISAFIEKPSAETLPGGSDSYYINAGFYVLSPEVVASIPVGRKVSIEKETFPETIAARGPLTMFPFSDFWIDVGTYEGYFRANFAVLARGLANPADEYWADRQGHDGRPRDYEAFEPLVYAERTARTGVKVDLHEQVIMMAESRVGPGSSLRRTILLPGASVGRSCKISNAIVGTGEHIPDGTEFDNKLWYRGQEDLKL